MTLRGEIEIPFGAATSYGTAAITRIFEYESADRTRAWKVRYANVWVQEAITGTGGGDARALLQVALTTDGYGKSEPNIVDAGTAGRWEIALGPSDNRTIAWSTTDMLIRDAVNADWIVPHGATLGSGTALICDFDRIITNELYIATYGITEGSGTTQVSGYYIELEEIRVSPAESVVNQIKGVGQDADEPFFPNP
jgi:hypothetical protein